MIKNFNNKGEKVWDDLKESINKWSKIDIAAAIFSIYGYESLKKELNNIDKLRFIFTDPTFVEIDKKSREQKMFEITSNNIKKSIGWTNFEINLKNKLKWKAIAKECKKWIEKKVSFKSNITNRQIDPQLILKNDDSEFIYTNMKEFSSAGLWYENDNAILSYVMKIDEVQTTKEFIENFDEVWNDENTLKDITNKVLNYISDLYKENSPEYIYYLTLYNIFDEFLEDISEDELANEKTGFKESVIWNKMYDFQKDAVLWIINKLERHNGCILADSVWLGKTFSALWVIKYYQERNKSVLVLCPKKLWDNWQTFLNNYNDNPLIKDRFNYDVLYHTDLSREKWESNGIDLSRVNWWNYDLVVIDESHNFRNNAPRKDKITRYQKLLNNVMKAWVKTKVLMLSATPVNNKFTDLKNQIALAYEWYTDKIDEKMDISKSIDTILKNAQKTFNDWSKLDIEKRTWPELLKRLNTNFDFFKLLDSITIARSRKHIEKYYDIAKIWKFPNRLPPITKESKITNIENFMKIKDIYEELSKLNMSVYSPFEYILLKKIKKYDELYDTNISENVNLKQSNRDKNIQKLMKINLLKRLESSVDSFRITLNKFISKIDTTINDIENFEKDWITFVSDFTQIDNVNLDDDDWLSEEFSIWDKVKINLEDMNTSGWKEDLSRDLDIAKNLLSEMDRVIPEKDQKLQDLLEIIKNKVENPINPNNKKIIIFSAFADTVNYLYNNLITPCKDGLWLELAKITGSAKNECTLKIDNQFNNLLINFSPISKWRKQTYENNKEIDILIATDCISEWQNLQDCDTLINYDIHWNPVRIIQRFWRIDRIWSKNKDIQLINFWPQLSLDDYINLKGRVESRMHMLDMSATGEDNVLTNKSSDLNFRKKQLEKLKDEVVDIEDMDNWISIMDLWLNDFRMDLINYIKEKWDLDWISNWMHSVCRSYPEKWIEPGVIFILKNINNDINIENTNQLHPFYLVYIREDWEVLSNHLNVKNTLDILRSIAKWEDEPIKEVYELFNEETSDWKHMDKYSELLNNSIDSILNVKDETDIESLFTIWWTTALVNDIQWLNDFELIAFVIIK